MCVVKCWTVSVARTDEVVSVWNHRVQDASDGERRQAKSRWRARWQPRWVAGSLMNLFGAISSFLAWAVWSAWLAQMNGEEVGSRHRTLAAWTLNVLQPCCLFPSSFCFFSFYLGFKLFLWGGGLLQVGHLTAHVLCCRTCPRVQQWRPHRLVSFRKKTPRTVG